MDGFHWITLNEFKGVINMIGFRQKGDFSKTSNYFKKLRNAKIVRILERYGQEGVSALSSATPVDTGETADSWYSRVEVNDTSAILMFCNSHVNKGVNIAIILQYGHGTGTGGWVEGRDYINPAIQPIFDKIVKEAWGEVTRL